MDGRTTVGGCRRVAVLPHSPCMLASALMPLDLGGELGHDLHRDAVSDAVEKPFGPAIWTSTLFPKFVSHLLHPLDTNFEGGNLAAPTMMPKSG